MIFKEVKEGCKMNKMLPVEMLFRFKDFNIKEKILSNYKGIRSDLKEEKLILDITDEEN